MPCYIHAESWENGFSKCTCQTGGPSRYVQLGFLSGVLADHSVLPVRLNGFTGMSAWKRYRDSWTVVIAWSFKHRLSIEHTPVSVVLVVALLPTSYQRQPAMFLPFQDMKSKSIFNRWWSQTQWSGLMLMFTLIVKLAYWRQSFLCSKVCPFLQYNIFL